MKCPKCDIDLMPGYAINPHGIGVYGERVPTGRPAFGPYPLKAEQVEIIFTAKCSLCGHNEELSHSQQSKLQNVTPPGYADWNVYWAAEKKELPRKWFRSILEAPDPRR